MSKFKVSKYLQGCHCTARSTKPREKSVIVKFKAEMAKFDIGISSTNMKCPSCGNRRYFIIDTWWGGEFTNKDTIYEDTARKKKLKVSELADVTDTLLENRVFDLKTEANRKKKEFESVNSKLELLNNVLVKGKGKKEKGKKENGQREEEC